MEIFEFFILKVCQIRLRQIKISALWPDKEAAFPLVFKRVYTASTKLGQEWKRRCLGNCPLKNINLSISIALSLSLFSFYLSSSLINNTYQHILSVYLYSCLSSYLLISLCFFISFSSPKIFSPLHSQLCVFVTL